MFDTNPIQPITHCLTMGLSTQAEAQSFYWIVLIQVSWNTSDIIVDARPVHHMMRARYVSQFVHQSGVGKLTLRLAHRHALYGSTMTLRTAISLLHAQDTVRGVTGAVWESEAGVCLALLVQGNWALRYHTEIFWWWKGPTYPYRYQYRGSVQLSDIWVSSEYRVTASL